MAALGLENEEIPLAGATATAGAGVAGLDSSSALSRPPYHTVKAVRILVMDMRIRVGGVMYLKCGIRAMDTCHGSGLRRGV